MPKKSESLLPGEYIIEKLLDKRKVGRKVQYLVRWEGWPSSAHSWMFKQDLPVWVVKKFETQLTKRANDLNFKNCEIFCRYQKKPPILNPVKKIRQRKSTKKAPEMPILEIEILEWDKVCHRKRKIGGTNCTKPKPVSTVHIDVKFNPSVKERTTRNSRGLRNLSTNTILPKPLSLKRESSPIEEFDEILSRFEDIVEDEDESLLPITDGDSGIGDLEAGEVEQNVSQLSDEVTQHVEITIPTYEDRHDLEEMDSTREPNVPTTHEVTEEISTQFEHLVINGMAVVIEKSENLEENVIQVSEEQSKVVGNVITVFEDTYDLVEKINSIKDLNTTTIPQLPKDVEFVDLTMDDLENGTEKLDELPILIIKTSEEQSEFVENTVTKFENNDDFVEKINFTNDANGTTTPQHTEKILIKFINLVIDEITEKLSKLHIEDVDDMLESIIKNDLGYTGCSSSQSPPSYEDAVALVLNNADNIVLDGNEPLDYFEDLNITSGSIEPLTFDGEKYGIECNIGEDSDYMFFPPLECPPVISPKNHSVTTSSNILSMEPCCSSSLTAGACSSVEKPFPGLSNLTRLIDLDDSLIGVKAPILEDCQNLQLGSIMGILRAPNQELLVLCSFQNDRPPGLLRFSQARFLYEDSLIGYFEDILKRGKKPKIEYKLTTAEMEILNPSGSINPNDDSDIEEIHSGNATTESESSDEEN